MAAGAAAATREVLPCRLAPEPPTGEIGSRECALQTRSHQAARFTFSMPQCIPFLAAGRHGVWAA